LCIAACTTGHIEVQPEPDSGSSDGDSDGDTDGDSDGDTDGDSDGDTDGDSDGDTDADSDGDTDSDTDTDTDTDTDADGDSDCPANSAFPCRCAGDCDDGSPCLIIDGIEPDPPNAGFCSNQCSSDADCTSGFAGTGACMLNFEENTHCALKCTTDDDCPVELSCKNNGNENFCHP